MDVSFFGINNLICFVLFIYLIPIIVGPPKPDENFNPRKKFTIQIHHDCFDSIQRIFDVPIPTRRWKKEYFQYGIRYLRFTTKEEKYAYYKSKAPGGHTVKQFLLYNGKDGKVYNEEFAYEYFDYLSTRFKVLSKDFHPYVFCGKYPAEEKSCRFALEYFGFVKGNMREIIQFAFLKIVYSDIEHHDYIPQPNSASLETYYALAYLLVLQGNSNTTLGKRPEDFSRTTDKEERSISY